MATGRVYSEAVVLGENLTVSLIMDVIERTLTPLVIGANLASAVSVSPAAQALWGRRMLYISFPGQVLSISDDCWYSRESGVKERMIVIGRTAWKFWVRPGRWTTARSLYEIFAPPSMEVETLQGKWPPTCSWKGKLWRPALRVWLCVFLPSRKVQSCS